MALAITSITPNNGTASGGSTVVIVGTDFEALQATGNVTFGGVLVKAYVSWEDLSITVVTPRHQIGSVDVVVTNDAGDDVIKVGGFTYTLPLFSSSLFNGSRFSIGVGP